MAVGPLPWFNLTEQFVIRQLRLLKKSNLPPVQSARDSAMIISTADLEAMEKLPRVQLATTLPGPKPICLVGTRSITGTSNLAPFSSITHFGSNPVLLGMVTRPDTVDRHTLKNILDTKEWSLNHITAGILKNAHQCSARYPSTISEFEATGLTEFHHTGFESPFVKESPLRIGLALEEIVDIPSNDTKLIVGRVKLIDLPEHTIKKDGSLDLTELGTVASTALDTYFSITEIARLPYAKPNSQFKKQQVTKTSGVGKAP